MNRQCVVGVDVGTGSVRALVVHLDTADVLAFAVHPIQVWQYSQHHFEQSSEDIWNAIGSAVKAALMQGEIDPDTVMGISFAATCSLVVLDSSNNPISTSLSGQHHRNIILWMDHRAIEQADLINKEFESDGDCSPLRFVGGKISPEMQPCKILWLKHHLPETWKKMAKFMDLADFLTFQCTGSEIRSICTVTCKWIYDAPKQQWNPEFWKRLGLEDLCDDDFSRIGSIVRDVGFNLEPGLLPDAAIHLGLRTGTSVGVGLIDAHAGGIGMLGAPLNIESSIPLHQRMAIISGTSSCFMCSTETMIEVPGVWGPYLSAMVPGYWLLEAGQSASGKLIDFIVETHPAFPELQLESKEKDLDFFSLLSLKAEVVAKERRLDSIQFLSKDLHILPDFHGNRSPFADSRILGLISGLSLDSSVSDLATKYIAVCQALIYETLLILDHMRKHGIEIKILFGCGSLFKSEFFSQTFSDVLGLPIMIPQDINAVNRGAAIAAACASGFAQSLQDAMLKLSSPGVMIQPKASSKEKEYHLAKYRVFQLLYQHQKEYADTMSHMSP